MATSRVNSSAHTTIIRSIMDVSKDGFNATSPSRPRGFKHSLDEILSDFQDQITIDAGWVRVGRRPETPVLDTWREWDTIRRSGYHDAVRRRRTRELFPCTFHSRSVTVDFIEKILPVVPLSAFNFTWGTLLRYLRFLQKNSEGFIRPTVEGECSWEDHRSLVSRIFIEYGVEHPDDLGAGGVPEYWLTKFNNEEEESIHTLTGERAQELGYLVAEPTPGPTPGPTPEPTPEQTPEQTPTQRTNASVRKFQDIIDSLSRGEKYEINEGDYLQLSDYLKRSFVSQ
jgi:hypothetical protein